MEAPEGYRLPRWYAAFVAGLVLMCAVLIVGGLVSLLTLDGEESRTAATGVLFAAVIVLVTVTANESRKSWKVRDFRDALRRGKGS